MKGASSYEGDIGRRELPRTNPIQFGSQQRTRNEISMLAAVFSLYTIKQGAENYYFISDNFRTKYLCL